MTLAGRTVRARRLKHHYMVAPSPHLGDVRPVIRCTAMLVSRTVCAPDSTFRRSTIPTLQHAAQPCPARSVLYAML
eukprot:scaffold20698_cov87-Phaeocystis_antarctica.AAC.1